MNQNEKLKLADEAITHVLYRIHESPEVGYYMGHGTESFARLCTAYTAMHGGTSNSALELFAPTKARDPRRDLEKRIDDLEKALEARAESGCGIEDIPTYGPQNLTALDFMEQVKTLLLTRSLEPAQFVAAIAELFDAVDVPYHCIPR